jgi:hypothetical protein
MIDEPAFPHTEPSHPSDRHGPEHHHGMTLRDYYAAKAMQAVASRFNLDHPGELARRSFEIADAMLASRANTSGDRKSKET